MVKTVFKTEFECLRLFGAEIDSLLWVFTMIEVDMALPCFKNLIFVILAVLRQSA